MNLLLAILSRGGGREVGPDRQNQLILTLPARDAYEIRVALAVGG